MSNYGDKLRDPRWQKKRLHIMERDGWRCVKCYDDKSNLQVDHAYYVAGAQPWDYPDLSLQTLCENCHEGVTIERRSRPKQQWVVLRSEDSVDHVFTLSDWPGGGGDSGVVIANDVDTLSPQFQSALRALAAVAYDRGNALNFIAELNGAFFFKESNNGISYVAARPGTEEAATKEFGLGAQWKVIS